MHDTILNKISGFAALPEIILSLKVTNNHDRTNINEGVKHFRKGAKIAWKTHAAQIFIVHLCIRNCWAGSGISMERPHVVHRFFCYEAQHSHAFRIRINAYIMLHDIKLICVRIAEQKKNKCMDGSGRRRFS